MDIAKTGRDGEIWANLGEGTVDVIDVLGLGVEGVVVNALVVNSIFFPACDTDFLLQRLEADPALRVRQDLPSPATASLARPS